MLVDCSLGARPAQGTATTEDIRCLSSLADARTSVPTVRRRIIAARRLTDDCGRAYMHSMVCSWAQAKFTQPVGTCVRPHQTIASCSGCSLLVLACKSIFLSLQNRWFWVARMAFLLCRRCVFVKKLRRWG